MRPSGRAEYDSSPNEAQRHVAIPSSFPPLMRSRWLFNNCAIFGVRSASFARYGEWPSLRVRRHPRMTPCPKTDSMRERAYRHRTPRRFAPNNQNASREAPAKLQHASSRVRRPQRVGTRGGDAPGRARASRWGNARQSTSAGTYLVPGGHPATLRALFDLSRSLKSLVSPARIELATR